MHTLQQAHNELTQKGLCPIYHSKLKLDHNGKFISSPYAIAVYCPLNLLGKYMSLLPAGFKVVYWPEFEEIRIMPENAKFQFIANQIYSCVHSEQLECCAKMIETHFPGDTTLIALLVQGYRYMNKSPA